MAREYRTFSYRGATLRIASSRIDLVEAEVRRQRRLLDVYVRRDPGFLVAMTPVLPLPDSPEIARAMAEAAWRVGVGPMAAVAGAVAERGARAALEAGAAEAIVENGGDLFLASPEEVVVGLYTGQEGLAGKIALRIKPERMPLSVCSSSSRMGHSLSLGSCDLATVVARDGALADAAATLACNMVSRPEDVEAALEAVASIPGIQGLLIAMGERVGIAGDLPPLVRQRDARLPEKISRHPGARVE